MTFQLMLVLALLFAVFVAFVSGRRRAHFVAPAGFFIIVASGVVEFSEAVTVFTSPAPLTIAMTFVLGAALERTGFVEIVGRLVSHRAGGSVSKALLMLMGAAALCSAAMNNTPVVIFMIPLAVSLARDLGVSPSRLLMPLSFAAILGGSVTLLGASSNILVSDRAAALGQPPLGMFEMTGPGLIFAAVGLAYVFLVGRRLLPDRLMGSPGVKPRREREEILDTVAKTVTRAVGFIAGWLRSAAGLPSAANASAGHGGAADAGGTRSYRYTKLPIALSAIVCVMLLSALGLAPILYLVIAAAVLVVVTGCVTRREMLKAIDWKLVLMIFGMIGLSVGLEKTGGLDLLSQGLLSVSGVESPVLALLLLYLITSALTELVTNNAVALMMTPIALTLAETLAVSPRAFLVAVMFAASASFATPIGYHSNLIVQRVGGYRFHDYLVVGLPLNILLALLAAVLLPVFYPM